MKTCCKKYKGTYVFGEKINYCPICGKCFDFKIDNIPIINSLKKYHIRMRNLNCYDDKEFIYMIAQQKKVAEGLFLNADNNLKIISELMDEIENYSNWKFISGYVKIN